MVVARLSAVLLFAAVVLVIPYRIANVSERLDAIGSTRGPEEVRAAGWRVGATWLACYALLVATGGYLAARTGLGYPLAAATVALGAWMAVAWNPATPDDAPVDPLVRRLAGGLVVAAGLMFAGLTLA